MDNFAYLNQISKSARAKSTPVVKKSGSPLAKLSIGRIAIIGIVGFFLLMAVGGLIGNINGKPKELSKQLYLRTTNLSSILTTYNPSVKSSRLRSISVSLISVLNHTSGQLSTYIGGEKSKDDDLLPKQKTIDSETALSEELNLSLNHAKLNGILDRTYENQLTLQVSLLLSLTSQVLARTKDEALTSILKSFYFSLETIHNSLESYTDLSN